MCFNQGVISFVNGGNLKLVDKFSYFDSSVSSTESDINIHLAKAQPAIDWLSIIWKSDLSDKIKQDFFQAMVVSILLYGCTAWRVTKHVEKKLDENCTRMVWVILKKSWKQQLYCHLPSTTKTIQVRQIRHMGLCWRSRDKLISNVLLWTPTHGCVSAG